MGKSHIIAKKTALDLDPDPLLWNPAFHPTVVKKVKLIIDKRGTGSIPEHRPLTVYGKRYVKRLRTGLEGNRHRHWASGSKAMEMRGSSMPAWL
eukprot:631359-Amphidinium_carterae.1